MNREALPLDDRDLEGFFERTPDLVCAQQARKIIYANAAFVRLRGANAQSFLGRQLTSLTAPADRGRVAAQPREPGLTRARRDWRCLRKT